MVNKISVNLPQNLESPWKRDYADHLACEPICGGRVVNSGRRPTLNVGGTIFSAGPTELCQ